jgi:hypothetical protein
MRKLLLLLCLLIYVSLNHATGQCITDANFRQAIISICPDCIDVNGCLLPEAKTLDNLNVSGKSIADLSGIEGFTGLKELYCNNNDLITIADLPDSLELLYCSDNQLTALPAMLPIKLEQLKCENNKLNALPALPNSLLILFCSDNLLSDLPALPNNLDNLTCNDNFLMSLPPLPNKLTSIHVNLNQLTKLPELPNTLKKLFCEQNQLQSLPELPESLKTLEISGNPIACLPELPFDIEVIGYDFTNINCLPNLPAIFQVVSPLPLCISGLSNCALNPVVKGNVFVDFDGDGIQDGTDIAFPGIAVKANIENWAGYSDQSGTYEMSTGFGTTYSLSVSPPPGNYTVSPAVPYVVSFNDTSGQTIENVNFGIHPVTDSHDLGVTITSGQMVSGIKCTYYLTYTNKSPFTINGSVQLQHDEKITFVGADIPPFLENGTVLTWTITGLEPFASQTITAKFDVPIAVEAGTMLYFSALGVISSNTDVYPDDNTKSDSALVLGSGISNYKTTNITTILPSVLIAGNEEIEYTIFFQNNGTTNAQHLDLYDTLSNNIVGATFELLAMSHDGVLSIKNITQNPSHPLVLHWDFDDIKLPSSSNDPFGSRGFVKFKVKPLSTLTQGSKILNKGIIQFSNATIPVVTNTVTTNIMYPVSVFEDENASIQFEASPNPFTDQLTFKYVLIQPEDITFSLINTLGVVIWKQEMRQASHQSITIDLPFIPSGTYILQAKGEHILASMRMIKL